MVAPTPETRPSLVLLNWSSVRPRGTLNTPAISIQLNSAAAILDWLKIKQLHVKLTSTAAIEIKLLTAFHLSVNSVITAALTNGATRMIHGKIEFIRSLKFKAADVFDVGCLARPIKSDENTQPHSTVGPCHSDDEEDEHLRVVVGQAG